MNVIRDYLWYYTQDNLPHIKKLYSLYGVSLSDFLSALDELNYKNSIPLYKFIFGDDFTSLIPEPSKPQKFIYSFIDNIENEIKLFDNDSKIIIKEGYGFAEYYDKDIYNLEDNNLVIYNNSAIENKYDLHATLTHEITGHKYFYSYLVNSFKKAGGLFDNGAVATIEGYATYCEWNINKNVNSTILRERAINILNIDISDLPYNEKAELIYNLNLKYGYSDSISLQCKKDYLQYPGFLGLYYLGALLFEKYFKLDIDVLAKIANNNVLSDLFLKSL